MKGKGILWCANTLLGAVLLVGSGAVSAADTADDIAAMMAWWEKFGSDWENARELIELASDESLSTYSLAENTMEGEHGEGEQQQQ